MMNVNELDIQLYFKNNILCFEKILKNNNNDINKYYIEEFKSFSELKNFFSFDHSESNIKFSLENDKIIFYIKDHAETFIIDLKSLYYINVYIENSEKFFILSIVFKDCNGEHRIAERFFRNFKIFDNTYELIIDNNKTKRNISNIFNQYYLNYIKNKLI